MVVSYDPDLGIIIKLDVEDEAGNAATQCFITPDEARKMADELREAADYAEKVQPIPPTA